MKNSSLNPSPRFLVFLAIVLATTAPLFQPGPARAIVSARYGVNQSPVGTYRFDMPMSARRVYIASRTYFLYDGIYYQPVMLQGRVAYLAVDTTWQR